MIKKFGLSGFIDFVERQYGVYNVVMNENAVIATEMERVTPVVNTLYDVDDTFFSQAEKANVERISGRDMRIPLKLRPGGYFGHFNPDGGDLGIGAGPQYDKAVINTVHIRYACQWTKKAEWGTDDTRKAVINAFKDIMADAMPEFRRNSDSLCMTAGNGVLGTISVVSTAGGVDTYTLGTDGFGARLLRFGLKVNVYDATLATQRTAAVEPEITFYDLANKQIKVSPAVTGAIATDVIVISGLSGASPVSLNGVPYYQSNASTGTMLGLDRATTPEIRATRVNAGGALALAHTRRALNGLGDRMGKNRKLKLRAWMHPAQVQAYEELGQALMKIEKGSGNETLDLYFGDDIRLAGVPVTTSFSWDKKRIDFLVHEMWGRAEMRKPGFYEVDGKKIFELRGPSGGVATAQVFYITASWNLFSKNPAAGAYIDNLTVPTGY
jgi:hypothetical protein